MSSPSSKLTEKQRRFVEAYMGSATGNGTLAARTAGYSGTDSTLRQVAHENLQKTAIREAIDLRVESSDAVADREECQQFWTNLMRDTDIDLRDRMRASEFLVKSQGGFLERNSAPATHTGLVIIPSNGRE